jgi:hypothetical protein
MLHDEVKLLTWSREDIVYVNVTWSEIINMKSRGNCFLLLAKQAPAQYSYIKQEQLKRCVYVN